MMVDESLRKDLLVTFFRFCLISVASYVTVRYAFDVLNPNTKKKLKSKALEPLKRLGIDDKVIDGLNEHELAIASQLVCPEDIEVSWKDIAGLDDVIQELRNTVILPMRNPNLANHSKLMQAPKGVLLHGPPGVGKTMIAKATAREAGANFINLDISVLTDKWYGESQKFAAAVFSLAIKIQPSIIFIDEIDAFLRKRDNFDHEATSMMKAQFMQLWDGLGNNNRCLVVVMGATNLPNDVDPAIIRRMPATFSISLPNEEQRKHILSMILSQESINIDIDDLAKRCRNFSGADLKELCRRAAMERLKEISSDELEFKSQIENIRSISASDFEKAFNNMNNSIRMR